MNGSISLLASALLAVLPHIQQSVEVDVARDFPGIVAVFDSEFRDFYDYARFEAYHGKNVTPATLERLKKEWEAERAQGDTERAKLEEDPGQLYLFRLDARLKRRGDYFRNLLDSGYERVDDFKPFYIFVQKTNKRGFASFHRTVANFYGPWLKELLRLFEEEYAGPLGLERRNEHGAFALLVLTDRKAYDTYYKRLGLGSAAYARAHYDPELLLGVTYEEPGSLAVSEIDRRIPALHEMVHAFEFAYGAGQEESLQVTWFAEGLADYLAHHEGKDPLALGKRPVDGAALRHFVDWASESGKASAVFPLEELAGLRGYEQAIQRAWDRAQRLKLEPPQPLETMGLLYSSAYLWMHFLHQGEGGKYRDGIRAYIGAAITGKLEQKPLADFFQGTSPAELDAAFLKHVASEWKRSEKAAAAPAMRPLKRVDLPTDKPAGPATAKSAAPPLAVDPELELTAALGAAKSGLFGAAVERLRSLAERSDASALRAQIGSELARLEAAIDVRRRFFEHTSQPGSRKLRLPREDRVWLAQVESVDGDVVRLAKNNAGETEFSIEGLSPSYLAHEIGDERRYGFKAGWVLAYLEMLAGDEAWSKTLAKSTEPEARALAAAAKTDLSARMEQADSASALVEIAGRGEGSTPAESQAIFDAIAKLLREQGSLPLVASRREALLGRARSALAGAYEAKDPAQILNGRWEELSEGRVRLSYGFDAQAELQDFQLEELTDDFNLPEGMVLGEMRIEKSALVALGLCRIWNHVQLATPVEISYEFTEKPHNLENDGLLYQLPVYLFLGFLAQASDDFVAVLELNGIYEVEKGRPLKLPAHSVEARLGKKFKMVVSADETGKVAVSVNGQRGAQSRCRPDRAGATFLRTVGRLEFHSLTLTGQRTPETLAHWRDAWIEQQLAAAGLK